MAVIAFSQYRFTPADLREFRAIADPRIARGLWDDVSRQTGPDYDRLLVTFPNIERPVFSFERDRLGRYSLWFNDRQGWHNIGSGSSAAECLTIWRTRSSRPIAAQSRNLEQTLDQNKVG